MTTLSEGEDWLKELERLQAASTSSADVDATVEDKINYEGRRKLIIGLYLIAIRLKREVALKSEFPLEKLLVRSHLGLVEQNKLVQEVESSSARITTPLIIDGPKALDVVDNQYDRTLLYREFTERFEALITRIGERCLDDLLGQQPHDMMHMIMGLSGEILGRLGIDPKKGVTYAMLEDSMNAFPSETESVIDLITPGKQLAEEVVAAWNKSLEKGKRPVGVAKIIPPSGIGMGLFTLTREIASDMHLEQDTRGVLVTKVYELSIAKKAGFKAGTTPKDFSNMQGTLGGDVIIGVENKPINTVEDLWEYFEYYHVKGTKIRFKVLREGKPIEIAIVY